MDQNIEIAVRIKPFNNNALSPLCGWDSRSIQVTDRNLFTFDSVIQPDASQDQVFEKVGMRIISNILDGYNGCIFAFGQTGSGKTFTMTGDHNNDGLVQKCLKKLWNCVKNSQFFEIKLGYFEIYNQTIKDLLSNQENLIIREHAKTGFYVENLTEKIVESYDQFEQLVKYGISVRTVKETKLNHTSSRSHSVLQVNLAYKKKEGALMVLKHAKLTFIDLAGSEKQKQTQVEGQRLKEAANINKSLSTLSLVISKLSQQSQRKSGSGQMPVHIPFRNSVLTKILKNSLTGKSKIMIVCTVSLEEKFIDETVSTLRFAQMAKSIKMKVNKNEEQFDGTKQRLFEEFAQVKQKLSEIDEAHKEMSKENEELKRQNACLKDEVEKKEEEINELQVSLECMRLESKQVIQQMRTQSQMPYQNFPMSQSIPLYRSESQLPQNFNNYRNSQVQQSQIMKNNLQYSNTQSNNYLYQNQPQNTNNSQQPHGYSQASIFTSHISSSGESQRNSFCTIPEEDSKAENSGSESKGKVQIYVDERIIQLQGEIEKLKLENEFIKYYRELQEYEISELMKKNVFLSAKEQQIEQANNLFAELVRNQQFSHAQLKFLQTCLKNCQKDKMALQLSEEEKNNQKIRFNQTVERIKNLLMSYTKSQPTFEAYTIGEDFTNQKRSEMFRSPQKKEHSQSGINYFENPYQVEENFNKDLEIDQKNLWNKDVQKRQHKSQEKKRAIEEEDFTEVKASQTPMNSRQKISQVPLFYGKSTQMFNQISYQSSSQLPVFLQDSRSLISQTTNKLSNNELEYLKKDYQKMSNEVKDLKDEIEKYKISILEKDSLFEEKVIELQEALDKVKLIEQDLQTQKELLEIERQKNQQKQSKRSDNKLFEKEQQLTHMRQYISELQKKHDSQCNSLKLKHKQLQVTLGNFTLEKENIINEYRTCVSEYEAKLETIRQEFIQVKKQKKQLEIEYGVVNSQNILLTQRYNYLKSCAKNNNNTNRPQTPQKIYSKNSSFFSLSQGQQPSQQFSNHRHVNTQNNPLLPKPKQLSQKQCIEVIENKTLEYMYQAAYYFYKKCYNLEDIKRTFEQKLIQIQQEMNLLGNKHLSQLHQLDHQLVDAKRSALSHQQAVIDLKKQILDIKQQLYEKDKLIDKMCSNQKRIVQYSKLLETKLKQKNQKQLQAKQKGHNLSAQLRDNSLTPIYVQKNNRINWGRKSFINNESEDSLVSNGDTPVHLTDFIGSNSRRISTGPRSSIEKVRAQIEMDEAQVLRNEIEELSNQQSSQNPFKNREKEPSATQSFVSHTVTNEKLTQEEVLQEDENQLNFNLKNNKNHSYQGLFGNNGNHNRSKAASTKGHFPFNPPNDSIKGENVFKSKK